MESPSRMNIPLKEQPFCVGVICGKKIQYKRFSLTILSGLVLLANPDIQNFVYIPFVAFICALIVFWNFPVLVLFTNSRPLYYEDLFIENRNKIQMDINSQLRNKFESRFQSVLIFTNSLFVAALADYWFYKFTDNSDISYVSLMGITGGIVKIFQIVNHASGTVIFIITKIYLVRANGDPSHSIEMVDVLKMTTG